ncbi:FAD-binding oxidoreductase [Pseudalkalibacillus salsuginis]|uniref:FAD-binding oxidoreductase n=1 Tax=Pseudalkalibacillus salsuginis TaxID=2910972 RepID=UPI001F1EA718|nr:FAD-binding oxidoreductase [Pseudalkalibacillus salsuginis]MCF6409926.1 FAD-binding oxidoreductase [Pseudalkalibacillus salsuginis]
MKKLIVLAICTALYTSFVIFSLHKPSSVVSDDHMTDVGKLMPVKVKQVVKETELTSIKEVIEEAKREDLKVSIAGKRHSMGGHTYYHDSVVLDMTGYNKVLDFDKEKKTITVQSGITWDDIQQYINKHGLAIQVMQSQNIFTVGGSISVNAHGRDIRKGSLISTVNSFRLLTADGEIPTVSRKQNEELFYLALGGYGLFGVILDVELQLMDDELYEMTTEKLDYTEYSDYFREKVLDNQQAKMHLARISTAPDSFLTEMYVTNYELASEEGPLQEHDELRKERMTGISKFALGMARNFDWAKDVFWEIQKQYFLKANGDLISRNNVMRSESKFLEYEAENDNDVLQEYFVPVDKFTDYIDDLRDVLTAEELNLLNITVRYVNHEEGPVLSYSDEEMFALVLLINQGLSKKEQKKTGEIVRKMIDVTLTHGGRYYLPYMPYPTKEQMKRTYPRSEEFFEKKKQYDPDERFTNFFYEEYKQ